MDFFLHSRGPQRALAGVWPGARPAWRTGCPLSAGRGPEKTASARWRARCKEHFPHNFSRINLGNLSSALLQQGPEIWGWGAACIEYSCPLTAGQRLASSPAGLVRARPKCILSDQNCGVFFARPKFRKNCFDCTCLENALVLRGLWPAVRPCEYSLQAGPQQNPLRSHGRRNQNEGFDSLQNLGQSKKYERLDSIGPGMALLLFCLAFRLQREGSGT